MKVVVVEDGDYLDAKLVSKEIAAKLEGWQLEGGAHNIARRDGIGSLILDAWNEIGRLPDHYFQAVGGGPGPIGVQEMMQRLVDFGLAEDPFLGYTFLKIQNIVQFIMHGRKNEANL